MKKKLMLLLFIVTMLLGTNVFAKEKVGYCDYGDAKIHIYSNGSINVDASGGNPTISDTYKTQMTSRGKCYSYMYIDRAFRNSASFSDEQNTSLGEEHQLVNVSSSLSCYYDIRAFNDEADSKYIRLNVKKGANGSRIFVYYMNANKEYVELDLGKAGLKVSALYGRDGGNSGIVTYYLDKTPAESSLTIADPIDLYEIMKDATTCPKLSYEKWSDGTSTLVTVYPKSDYSSDLENVYASGSCKFEYSDGTVTDNNESDAGQSSNNMKVLCDKNGSIQYNDKTVKFNFRILTEDDKIKWGVQINGSYIDYDLSVKQSLSLREDDLNAHSAIKFQPDDELWDYLKEMEAGTKTACPSYIGAYYSNGYFSDSIATGDMSSGTYMITMDKNKATFDLNDGRTSDPGGSRHQEAVEKAKEREKDKEGTDVSGCTGLIGPNTLAFLNLALNVIMIAGPIIGVLLGMYELITAMAAGDDDAKKKGIKRLQNRLIASALLLLVPYIVKLILNIAGRGNSADCIDAMQKLAILRSNLF